MLTKEQEDMLRETREKYLDSLGIHRHSFEDTMRCFSECKICISNDLNAALKLLEVYRSIFLPYGGLNVENLNKRLEAETEYEKATTNTGV
jgi:hypothetical protein